MMRKQYEVFEDEHGQKVVRVPLTMMDGAPIEKARHRPGFGARSPTRDASDERARAFAEQGLRLRDAWRNPAPSRPAHKASGGDDRSAAWAAEGTRLRDSWRVAQ
jgi:hypothetical protein